MRERDRLFDPFVIKCSTPNIALTHHLHSSCLQFTHGCGLRGRQAGPPPPRLSGSLSPTAAPLRTFWSFILLLTLSLELVPFSQAHNDGASLESRLPR